jgi:biopolymer transport protein TolQ
MSWLATTGSVTPFIGLFGTVWGIMDAFTGLGDAGSASLRAVAPGIAEALVTTAMGLFAAIPAVIFYNNFVGDIRDLGQRLDTFALEVTAQVEKSLVTAMAVKQAAARVRMASGQQVHEAEVRCRNS